MPRAELDKLLRAADLERTGDERVLTGVYDDAGVVKISEDIAVVQHLDFVTPIIDDPYIQGKITACNAASDVFSKGASDVIGILVILGNPMNTPDYVLRELMRGFSEFCSTIRAPIIGGHTIINPWPIMGGAVTAIAKPTKIVYNSGAKPKDVLLLSKPLGTQPAMRTLRISPEDQETILKEIPQTVISRAIDKAVEVMTTANQEVAKTMVEVGVNAATDVTGFGLLGHTEIMAKRSSVDIVLHTLPVIRGTIELSKAFGYGLETGVSAETSGGLLISLNQDKAKILCSLLKKKELSVYEVGRVEEGSGIVRLSEKPAILEI